MEPADGPALIFEAPFERHVCRNVALAVVASLITERTLNNEITSGSDQWVQIAFLSEGDLADDLNMPPTDGNCLVPRSPGRATSLLAAVVI